MPQLPRPVNPLLRPPLGRTQRVVVAGRALPAPPAHLPGSSHEVWADEVAFQEEQAFRNRDTPARRIVAELLQASKRLNITTAPPAHIKPHIWSEPVDQTAQVEIPAGAADAYQTVCSFTTPPGRWARIEHYGVNVVDPASYAYDGTLLWAFRLRGRMLDLGMSDWGEQRGSMVFMRPVVILMNNEDVTLDFMVRRAVADATAYTVQMGFRGWTYRLRNNYEGTQGSVTAY